MIRPLEAAQDTQRNPGLEGKDSSTFLQYNFESGEASSLLDTDMRWKSEVKVECCMVSESETGSLLSNDEVSNGN